MALHEAQRIADLALCPSSTVEQIQRESAIFFACVELTTPPEAIEALKILARGIASPQDDIAALIATMCGSMVEKKAPALAMAEPLLRRLYSATKAARRLLDACQIPPGRRDSAEVLPLIEKLAPKMPTEIAGWRMLARLLPPAIIMYSADAQCRRVGRKMLEDLLALEPYHQAARWMARIVRVLDNEPYVAIDPVKRVGIVGKMSGVSENFQLNVLLMDIFPGPSDRVTPAAVATASGRGRQQGLESIRGRWNLYNYRALNPDRTLPGPEVPPSPKTRISNEGIPADIPVLLGHRIILIGPSGGSRTWKSQRDFAHLKAQLTDDERLIGGAALRWLDVILEARKG